MSFFRISAPTAAAASPVTRRRTAGPLRRRMCRSAFSARRGPIRSFAPTTARIPRTRTFPGQTIHFDLSDQSNGATQGHAQGGALTSAQRESIVDFETGLFTAQILDNNAGSLTVKGGLGGPQNLSQQNFYIGINDLFGDSQTGAPFSPDVFTIYGAWKGLTGGGENQARAAVARGEELFNTKLIHISDVSGINDE